MKKDTDWLPTVIVAGVILLFLLCLPSMARADEMEVWITSGFRSWHVDESSRHYRQNNNGGGVELVLSDRKSIYLGTYMNSLNKPATYLGFAYQPWHPFHLEGLKVGVISTLATGYTKDGSAVFVPLPTITYEQRGFGINLISVPTVVTCIQLKMRFN